MRGRQRGAAILLLVAAVLGLLGTAAFGLHRSVLREWALEGAALQGLRASAAAEAVLAWGLTAPRGEGGAGDRVLEVPEGVLPAGQTGEVRLRWLGEGAGGRWWKLTAEGRVQVPGGPFRQVREAYAVEAQGGALTVRAWRKVQR